MLINKCIMDVDAIEKEAHAAALVQVAQMFQRPDQLEKLDTFKKRADRKKTAVEAMLRTGVQSQLEGIRTAIGHLSTTVEDIKGVETSLQEIYTTLLAFPELKQKMAKLREANMKNSQYATSLGHLQHIYEINETIEKTREYVQDGKLLLAHKNIMEMEHARDDLMYEVHKLQQSNVNYEKNLLKTYFSDLDKVIQELAKQLWYICSRCLEAVRGAEQGPIQLVTALRIIEREERIDQYYIDRQSSTNNFMPPDRPRKWRQKCLEIIASTVKQRIEGNQLEDRSLNRQWLARYLEVCRFILVDDLMVAKSAASPCFPPSYGIYDRFVSMYHNLLSARLREIASDKLEKNELVQLLSWVNSYGSEQILGNPRLQINTAALLADHPLLSKSTITELCDRFIEITRRDMHEWLEKTLMQEKDDWYKDVHPEEERLGYFYTQLPSILFGMIEDTISLTKEVSHDIIPNVVEVSVDEFLNFANKYKDAAAAYKTKHFENRSNFKEFTATIIAVANNLDICTESTEKLKQHIRLKMEADVPPLNSSNIDVSSLSQSSRSSSIMVVSRQALLDKIDQLKKRWNIGMQSAVGTLLDEVNEDIAPHLAEILTKKWLSGSSALETICITIADYYSDHKHLRPHIRCALLMEIQYKIIGEYMIGIDSRRLSLTNYDDRCGASKLLKYDGERIAKLFSKLLNDVDVTFTDLTIILTAMSDVLNLRDKSLLALETTTLVRKFPDMHVELLSALIQTREDMGRVEAR
ncbi:exocyst complex component 3 family protein [Onchocerca flexuosa]|uniref:Exocyst complex component 3 family protein n=1 Tax=Onchocerca flexuosa TaxID=387005 RepID=A0A238BS84_9BILA|nr:exocyst complex component 3 family protein [Onchocerca flexuosa]